MEKNATELKLKAIKYILDNGYEQGVTPKNFRRKVKREAEYNALETSDTHLLDRVNDGIDNRCGNTGGGQSAKNTWAKARVTISDTSSAYDDLPMICSIINCALIEQPRRDQQRAEDERRRQQQEQERQARLNDASNVFAGQVRDQVGFIVKESSVYRYVEIPTGQGGSYPVMLLTDQDNKRYLGSNSNSLEIDPGDRVVGTIREQFVDRQGLKYVKIWRVSVTAAAEVDPELRQEEHHSSGLPFGE